MKLPKGRWVSGFWPMIFMSFSTGSVYCWTLFREDITAHAPAFTPFLLTLCFMLALFCLGMTAAFGGKLVERSVKRASLYTFIFFTAGWLITAIGVHIGSPLVAVIGFGPIQGIGLGLGYLTPVKTLMMWFDDKKGFAAGVAIAAFGLAGLVGNPLIGMLLQNFTVYQAFYILTGLYGVLCFVAYVIIDRPELKPYEAAARTLSLKEVIFKPKFVFLWMVLFINIAAGLALMSHEQQIYIMLGLDENLNRMMIVLFCTFTAGGGNLVGRLIMASSQDKTNKKHLPYYVMSIASIATCILAIFIGGFSHWSSFAIIFVVQFFFGAGFACLPEILNQQYGMKQLATIQGYMLTAWAIAALVGPQIATMILDITPSAPPNVSPTLSYLYATLAGMFVVQLGFLLLFVRAAKKDPPTHEVASAEA
ncbi:MAG: MFS transporter [Oscillospiraceae bacterium]|nr:MFS transporter [Oscillospiraceae bacterium]